MALITLGWFRREATFSPRLLRSNSSVIGGYKRQQVASLSGNMAGKNASAKKKKAAKPTKGKSGVKAGDLVVGKWETVPQVKGTSSCFSSVSTLYQRYHDDEWGRPVHDDGVLFESLCLSTQQCGVAWETVLKKRDAYREVYVNWDAAVLAAWSEDDVRRVLELPDARVIRHKGKVNAIVNAAQGVQKLAARGESLSDFVWRFVPEGKPIVRSHVTLGAPQFTAEAEAMSEALKKLGFSFIGPTVAYAFMQAVGIVNDHHPHCAQAVARRE